MINKNISNINKLAASHNSLEKRVDECIEKLRDDYESFKRENVFYKRASIFRVALSITMDIILAVLLFMLIGKGHNKGIISSIMGNAAEISNTEENFWSFAYARPRSVGLTYEETASVVIFYLLLAGLIICIYDTVISLYSKHLDGHERRIEKLKIDASNRFVGMKNDKFLETLSNHAMQNKEYAEPTGNDLGEEFASIRSRFEETNRRARAVKRGLDIGLSSVMYLLLIFYVLTRLRGKFGDPRAVAILCFAAAMIVNITQLIVSQYMGKYSKLVGGLMACVYGITLGVIIRKGYDVPFIDVSTDGILKTINSSYFAIPFLQAAAIIIMLCLTNYESEKERWKNGFTVVTANRTEKRVTQRRVIMSGLLSAIGVYLIFKIVLGIGMTSETAAMVAMLLCGSNPLFDRSSYMRAFWGSGRSAANVILVMFALFTSMAFKEGTIRMNELIMLMIAVGFALLLGLLGRFGNFFVRLLR